MDFMMNKTCETISPIPRKKSLNLVLEAMSWNFFHGKNVAFIGLCGGQASGKTQIANYFQKNIPGSAIIAERDFFKIGKTNRKMSSSDEPLVGDVDGYDPERKNLLIQLSNPEFYDHDKLINCLEKLAKSEEVDIPYYDEAEGTIKERSLNPKNTILFIVEGYFIFKNQKLRELFDLKLYTEVDDDVRLSRLILRENKYLKNNANAFKTFFLIYEKYLKTSFESNIEIGKKYANIILPNYEITDKGEIEKGDDTLEFLLVNLKNLNKQNS